MLKRRRLLLLSTIALITGCKKQDAIKAPEIREQDRSVLAARVPLLQYGLPKNFFNPADEAKHSNEIIEYRFVAWPDADTVVVGFSTSPNRRTASDQKVDGNLRLLAFDTKGQPKAQRDITYLADGNGEIVADGEAMRGPTGTLLIRIQSVNLDESHESPSAVLLLNNRLEDISKIQEFLEQVSFSEKTLVFQQGFTLSGPRTYSFYKGNPPTLVDQWAFNWPAGTMSRAFDQNQIAYTRCAQKTASNQYSYSNIIVQGADRLCDLVVQRRNQTEWSIPLAPNETAAVLGILSSGEVTGRINKTSKGGERLVIWHPDKTTTILPWLPATFEGEVKDATSDMSSYLAYGSNEEHSRFLFREGSKNRWLYLFDQKAPGPLVAKRISEDSRAALSPDGLRYASFESGVLLIYSLP